MSIRKGDDIIVGNQWNLIRKLVHLDVDTNHKDILNNATSVATAVQMPSDGIIMCQTAYNTTMTLFVLDKNKQLIQQYNFNGPGYASGDSENIILKKGEYVYRTGTNHITQLYFMEGSL